MLFYELYSCERKTDTKQRQILDMDNPCVKYGNKFENRKIYSLRKDIGNLRRG